MSTFSLRRSKETLENKGKEEQVKVATEEKQVETNVEIKEKPISKKK